MLTTDSACAYAALILQDEQVAITADRIRSILKAADVKLEPVWPDLFANALQNADMKSIISNISSGVASAPATAAPSQTEEAAGKKGEAKGKAKKEEVEESDDEMGFGLFA